VGRYTFEQVVVVGLLFTLVVGTALIAVVATLFGFA